MKNIKTKIMVKALAIREVAQAKVENAKAKLADTTGEGSVDTAVKIIIALVIGGLLLAGLVALFNNVIMPRVETEVTNMFGMGGGNP